jgi:hypothetical protein
MKSSAVLGAAVDLFAENDVKFMKCEHAKCQTQCRDRGFLKMAKVPDLKAVGLQAAAGGWRVLNLSYPDG